MSGTTPDPAAGANPFGELAKFALAATERNMALARSWSDALLTTLKEQSEDAQATLTIVAASANWPVRRTDWPPQRGQASSRTCVPPLLAPTAMPSWVWCPVGRPP